MSRQSISESTPRGILDTLRESKAVKVAALIGASASFLASCGKSGPDGWPENPCNVAEAAVPVSQEDGSDKGWICSTGGRNDGLTNEQAAGGDSANPSNIPTPVDIPTTATPTPSETSRTLTPQEQVDQNIAKETEVKHAYEYIVGGEKMTYDELVKHFIIPSNVTDPKLVANLLEQHLNELSNGGNTKEEYLQNDAAFDKAIAEDGYAIPAVEYRKFYADAFAETLVHPEIDANTDYIGRNIDPSFQKPLYREYTFTRDNAKPFTVKHDLTFIEGGYYPADESVARPVPEMGIRVNYDLTQSGASGKTKVENDVESTEQMIYLRVHDGRWVVLYTDQIE